MGVCRVARPPPAQPQINLVSRPQHQDLDMKFGDAERTEIKRRRKLTPTGEKPTSGARYAEEKPLGRETIIILLFYDLHLFNMYMLFTLDSFDW